VRLNAKGHGEFIRDHLIELPENRDFVGDMYHAYKDHLQAAAFIASCAQTMPKYVWMLKETGANLFDGAESSGWETSPLPLPGYVPACGMPAPRHYYRLSEYPGLTLPEASPLPRRRRRRKIEEE
jgi:hypothetical protein